MRGCAVVIAAALVTVGLALSTMAIPAAKAADWPQFRGPDRNNTSPEKGLPRAWAPGGPKVLWTVKLGVGYGPAAVRDGKVYILDRDAAKGDMLRCFDLAGGKEEWSFAYAAPGRLSHDGSRSTPAVGDKLIFIIGALGHLHAVDRQTHQCPWRKDLLREYGGQRPNWGVPQSPLIHKDTVIVAPLGRSAGVVALDQATGKEVWKSPALGPMQYASPVLTTIGGVEQVLVVSKPTVAGVEVGTGRLLWKFDGYKCNIPVPDLLPIGDGRVLITGGYNAGSVMIRVEKAEKADKTDKGVQEFAVTELARNGQIGAHTQTPILYQGHIYALCNTNERSDGLVCFDLDLKVKWQTGKSPNLDKGGMVLTGDGLIYSVDGKTGELRIIEPSPQGYKELAKVPMLAGQEIWAPLALADGKLLIRDQNQIKCLDLKGD